MSDFKNHTLSVVVLNKPGVLTRIAALFSRRGFNIESLAVGPTEDPALSRITLVANVDEVSLEQLTKQLNKLVEVLKIVELDDTAVRRELLMIKVRATPEIRSQVLEIVNLFRSKTVDIAADSMTIEATGGTDKIEALVRMLEPYGIKEYVQSGVVALSRGSRSLTDRTARGERARPIRIV
ncbi:acetolactate synthase small subunit [Granulicoccus sp. GXG6511]|uniref:acetolactate synthase small subunit n=1 Tax=Granulicoccus sp. GXG6511 TaxID=3381351 RepID=UPI003D7E45B1